jgi:Short C-terminal domain/Domain of unknown function (DUF4429)
MAQPQSSFCIHCGAPKRANGTFCTQCGASYSGASNRVAPAPPNENQVLLEARGRNGQLQLFPNKVRIIRKGAWALALQGVKGDKDIYIDQISSIQFKNPGVTVGYIQFSFLGGQETKSGIRDAMKDENTVAFLPKQRPAFEAIKQAVEQKMREIRSGRMQQPVQQVVQQPAPVDIPEQIEKLSKLKEQGILTEDEFQSKKQELLSRL